MAAIHRSDNAGLGRQDGQDAMGGTRRGTPAGPGREFAIAVNSVEALFGPLDGHPIAQRSLNENVRLHLLDQWDRVREARPSALIVDVAEAERSPSDQEAARAAIRNDLRIHTRPLWRAAPLSRREKIAAWVGIVMFVISIAISTTIDRISTAALVAGVSQGIVVVGWVALWGPTQRVAVDVVPHHFDRKRYAEFAEIDLRFVWPDATIPAAPARDAPAHRS